MSVRGDKVFVEFFAGIGLVHQGLRAGRWRCAYANDIDAKKEQMYLAAFPADEVYHRGDVWETAEVLARIDEPPLLATASFPCTDLSTAGRYEGLRGAQSSAFFAFRDVLAALADRGDRPPLVMIENVPGLLTSRGGEDFRTAAAALADLGYFLTALIVNARHFRPQSRPRLFLIGVADAEAAASMNADDAALFPGAEAAEAAEVRPARLVKAMSAAPLATGWFAPALPPLPPLRTDLADLIDTDDGQPWWPAEKVEHHLAMMSELHAGRIDEIRASGRPWVGTIFRRRRKDGVRAEVRFDGCAGCLRTPKGGSARQIVIAVDGPRTRMRWMTPREYARLQGADDFPLTVPDSQALFGFGDAVCVPVIEWIDRHLLSPLTDRLLRHDRRLSAQEAL